MYLYGLMCVCVHCTCMYLVDDSNAENTKKHTFLRLGDLFNCHLSYCRIALLHDMRFNTEH